MQEDKEGFFDTVKTLVACLEVIAPFLQSLQFNAEVMLKSSRSGYLDATKVLESLVSKGVSFRDAHHRVGEMVLEAVKHGKTLEEFMNEKTCGNINNLGKSTI